jgi:HAD superfamily hydrolase (TIGR01490 family)
VSTPQIVFVDVDETLITVKSMIRFLKYHLDRCESGSFDRAMAELAELGAAGASRDSLNQAYYGFFAGQSADAVIRQGREWFDCEMAGGTLFHEPVAAMCRTYQEQDARIALVSGSFAPCLEPIAEHVGAAWTLCGGPEVVGGIYHTRLMPTVIGVGKAAAVRDLLAQTSCEAARCVAIGDHSSDLPMLLTAGSAVVVGDDPILTEHAARRGWRVLPGVPGNHAEHVAASMNGGP